MISRNKIKEIMLKWRSGEIVSIETAVDTVLASVQQPERLGHRGSSGVSNYRGPAFNPATKRVENADFIDNYFGPHEYGVKFDDGLIVSPFQCNIWTAGDEVVRLQTEVKALIDTLKPFADCVFNDNGDMTVSSAKYNDYIRAYGVLKQVRHDNQH